MCHGSLASIASAVLTAVQASKPLQDALSYSQHHTTSGFAQKKSNVVSSQHSNAILCHNSSGNELLCLRRLTEDVWQQGLESEDASLVTGMLAPKRLDQLNEFLGASVPVPEQVNEPSLTTSSLHGLSLGDKVATLSALQPSVAAAILGKLSLRCHLDSHKGYDGS